MNQITLNKEELIIDCLPDQTILEATLEAGINHMHACGGNGKCSTCRVAISKGLEFCIDRNEKEQIIAEQLNFPPQVRLACQTIISNDVEMRRMITDELDMEIVNKQFKDKSGTSLGSEKYLTIAFTDIENYTPFVERFPPFDVVHMLNRYLLIMNQVVNEHNGFISDVVGDGILAVFGLHENSKNSALEALRAVEAMLHRLDEFNIYLNQNYESEFAIRVGLHYGQVILGPFDIGSMKKLAVIGDSVNMASRIETANKELGTRILMSKDVYQKVRNQYPDLKSYQLNLKGKSGEFELFEYPIKE